MPKTLLKLSRCLLRGVLLAALVGPHTGHTAPTANPATNDAARPPFKEWQKTLDDTDKELAQPDITDPRLVERREELLALERALRQSREAANEQVELIRRDLDTLGPPPAEGAPPEAPSLAERRKRLNERSAAADGAAKEADLLLGRIARYADTINQLRRTRFTERVLTRGQSPLSSAVWSKAAPEWLAIWISIADPVQSWLADPGSSQASREMGMRLTIGVGLALLLAFPIRLWMARRLARSLPAGPPSDLQRLRAAALTGLLNAWLPSMAAIALYVSLTVHEPLSPAAAMLARDALTAAVLVSVTASFCEAALRPQRPSLRLAPLSDEGARIVTRVVTWLALLFAVDFLLSDLLSQRDVSVEVLATQHLLLGLLVSLVLTGLLAPRVWIAPKQAGGLSATQRRLRSGLMLLIAAIPISAILGYVALSRLLATHWVLTAGLLALLALLGRVGQELVTQVISPDSTPGRYLRKQLTLTDDGAEMLGFWGIVTLKTTIGVAGAVALLLLWSLDRKDVLLWIEESFYGFKLGGILISPAEILLGLLLFTVLLTATRLLQRTLDRRIFPRTRLDSGLRHSIRSAVGYAGFAIAAMLGISTMGIDLSSLAIIAGALSVGIGFGLQNIVNNFVSGLILLIERPIKAGDWVVVGEHQGYVRQISVRATEITTFDRASVFIPNSSLISGAVMNRTYADKMGRVLLPIGIAYEADPHQARQVLLDIARANPDVRQNPPPAVFMGGFGDSAVNLELMAFLHDVDRVKTVTSDLCFAIHAAFREHGIRIPYPQRDVRVSLDDEQLRGVLGGREPPAKPKPAASSMLSSS